MASDLPIYLILGHGSEKVGEPNERERLPEGYTLVTYSEAGNASFMEEVCKTLHLFKNPYNLELLADPLEHRNELEEELNHSIQTGPKRGSHGLRRNTLSVKWRAYTSPQEPLNFFRSYLSL